MNRTNERPNEPVKKTQCGRSYRMKVYGPEMKKGDSRIKRRRSVKLESAFREKGFAKLKLGTGTCTGTIQKYGLDHRF